MDWLIEEIGQGIFSAFERLVYMNYCLVDSLLNALHTLLMLIYSIGTNLTAQYSNWCTLLIAAVETG